MEHTDLPDLTVNSPLWRAVVGIGRGSGKMSTGRNCDSRKPWCWRASLPRRAMSVSGSDVKPACQVLDLDIVRDDMLLLPIEPREQRNGY
jgi:hypothetical protein